MIKNDLESALALWDALDDKAEVFVPIILNPAGSEGHKNYFFAERGALPIDKDKLYIRVFVNKKEADSYRLNKNNSKIATATTTVENLFAALEKNVKNGIDKKIDCVLSTLDMEGNFHALETIWSNTNRNS